MLLGIIEGIRHGIQILVQIRYEGVNQFFNPYIISDPVFGLIISFVVNALNYKSFV
jgi:hypothetical protein